MSDAPGGLAPSTAATTARPPAARPLRVLHVTPLYAPADGGAERHARVVSERLAARGHDVQVLTTNAATDHQLYHGEEGALPPEETIGGVHVRRLPTGPDASARFLGAIATLPGGYRLATRVFGRGGVRQLTGSPRTSRFVRSILRSRHDLVGCWNWYWPVAYHAYLARRVRRFPLVGIPLFHTAEDWAGREVHARMLGACAGVVANTSHEARFVASRCAPTPPVVVAGAGIEPADFQRADGEGFRRRHGLSDRPLVGFLGRLIPGKGADRVLRAMSHVWRWSEDATVVVAGRASGPFPVLDQLAARLAEERPGRVRILADLPESDKADLLDALDVFVMPSTGESFGIAYLEAWMLAKPVIGSRLGSTPDVIEDGVDGLLADPDDHAELGDAIVRVLRAPAFAAALGERGRARTLAHHTWERVLDRVEAFYAGVAASAVLAPALR